MPTPRSVLGASRLRASAPPKSLAALAQGGVLGRFMETGSELSRKRLHGEGAHAGAVSRAGGDEI